jgi:hypothetical protein
MLKTHLTICVVASLLAYGGIALAEDQPAPPPAPIKAEAGKNQELLNAVKSPIDKAKGVEAMVNQKAKERTDAGEKAGQ